MALLPGLSGASSGVLTVVGMAAACDASAGLELWDARVQGGKGKLVHTKIVF